MDNQLKEIKVISEESWKIGYQKAKEDLKDLINLKIDILKNNTINSNKHMNDLEYGEYTTLQDILDLLV